MSSISSGTTSTTGYVVSSDTTGALVLKTGSAATTAVTIDTSQNVTFAGSQTLSAGTANGVAYLNGSKVLTSGSALVFDGANLGVGVTPSAWVGSKALQVKGVGAFYSDGETYAYTTGVANNCYQTGNNTWAYRIAATSAARYEQNSNAHYWFISSGAVSAGGAVTFTQAMTLDANGNLGVGATSITPRDSGSRTLELYGTSSGRAAIKFTNATSGTGATDGMFLGYDDNLNFAIVNNESGVITLGTSNTERARITAAGEFLVGATTSNSAKLTIANAGAEVFQFYPGVSSNENQTLHYNRSTAVYCTSSVYAADHRFFIQGNEKARITSSGYLLLGTTSAGFSNSNSITLQAAEGYSVINHANGTGSGTNYIWFGYNAGSIGTISQGGTSSVNYNTSSDYRLKNTITPMTGALAKVALLKPCTYKWNIDGSNGEGFIAHELAEVCPQAVTGEKDAIETYVDEDGNEQTRPVYQGIDTSFLVATLTAAIQEQQLLIQQLQADVAFLKGGQQ